MADEAVVRYALNDLSIRSKWRSGLE